MVPNLWCKRNGIKHIRVTPYHPSSNGLAERAVRIFKEGIAKQSQGTLSDRLGRMLFEYRQTPQTTTGVSPAELIFGRPLRSRLSLLHPCLEAKVQDKQMKQKHNHDVTAKNRLFAVGDRVFVRRKGKKVWIAGLIREKTGPVSFRVESLADGGLLRCHVEQIRKRFPENEVESEVVIPQPIDPDELQLPDNENSTDDQNQQDQPVADVSVRRSTRIRHPSSREI